MIRETTLNLSLMNQSHLSGGTSEHSLRELMPQWNVLRHCTSYKTIILTTSITHYILAAQQHVKLLPPIQVT